ncbi:serine protease [Aquabacter sp. CN5-332]|uniref:S1C family serine protease n=1 Tax=Aquabacter sp. CN5-332 TaxID=3156608 RepID=UPI0032B4C2A6
MGRIRLFLRRAWMVVAVFILAVAGIPRAEAAPPALVVDKLIDKVEGWSIGFSEGMGGCLAAATYRDQTTIWVGFGGKGDDAYFAVTNPKWGALEPGKRYELSISAQGEGLWRGQFTAIVRKGEKGLFAGNLKDEFVVDLANSGALDVRMSTKSIARLSLEGSKAAIRSTVGCQVAYREARTAPSSKSARTSPPKKDEGGGSGTGFFVSTQGHVLTNHHVVEGCRRLQIVRPLSAPIPATLVADDATNDLALLQTAARPADVPPLMLRPRVGHKVYVFGYPLAGVLATSGNFTDGLVTASAGLGDDTRMLQISAPVQPGNSGGPLLDQNGNVIGVIVSKLNVLKLASVTNDLAQNVNFAIKSSIAANFLDANGVQGPPTPYDGALEPSVLAEKAKGFTVRVNCD